MCVAKSRPVVSARETEVLALPAPLTTFISRVRERAELGETVRTHRQVTAAGPGGVGKTQLTLAVAAEVAGDFVHGVWVVDSHREEPFGGVRWVKCSGRPASYSSR
jgi:hypothetical protein